MKKLYVYSNPTIDIVCTLGSCSEPRAGGPAYYAALAGKILGFEVWVYGSIGRDGHLVLREYKSRGVRFARLGFTLEELTTRFRLRYEGSNRVLEVLEVGPMNFNAEPREPRILSPVLQEFPRSVARRLARSSTVDVQGLIRERTRGVVKFNTGFCKEVVSEAHIVHADASEALYCMGISSYNELLATIVDDSRNDRVYLVTAGIRGSLVIHDGRIHHVRAWGPKAEDSTGMGDVYTSAFTYAYSEGLDAQTAAQIASIVAGLHAKRDYRMRGLEQILRLSHEVSVRPVSLDDATIILTG